MEGLTVLNAMTAPGVLISACGLLLLGIYNKYSKVVESLRKLNHEHRSLTFGEDDVRHPAHEVRLQQIDAEWTLLRRRLGCTLRQMQSVAAAAVLFLVASLLIACQLLIHVPTIGSAIVMVCVGVTALMVAMGQAVWEAKMISRVIDEEDPTVAAKAVQDFELDADQRIAGAKNLTATYRH